MATPFELAALGLCACVRVCASREACSRHKTKGLFCPRSPPGQLVTGAAGKLEATLREGKRGRASQCVSESKRVREIRETADTGGKGKTQRETTIEEELH